MRTNQLQRAIDNLKAERAVLDAAIGKLEQQQAQSKPKARKAKVVAAQPQDIEAMRR